MARQLWLLRHAEAEPHGTRPDSERRLTRRGEQQARAAGIAIQSLAVAFDEVLFSPKVRAAKTAELAAEGWSSQQRALLREHPPLAGGFDVLQGLDALAGVPAEDGRLLLVGHEPDLSLLAGGLTGGRIDLKKGGLAVVRLEGGAQRLEGEASPRLDGVAGELAILMRPRELALIAGVGGIPINRD
jgi:phosphohistidine phosphatase